MPVFTDKFDPSIVRSLSNAGVVDAIDLDSDTPAVMRIKDPYKFALATSTAFNRVPKAVEAWMAAGLSSPNQQDVADAASAYAMLSLHAPQLADAMNLGGDGSLDAARAMFIRSRMGQFAKTAGTDNHLLRTSIAGLMQEAMSLNPKAMQIKNEQAWGLAWWKDDAHHFQDLNAETTMMARKDVGDAVASLGFDDDGAKVIPAEVVNDYKARVAEQYRIAKSTIPETSAALEMAKKHAMAGTLQAHRPYQWGGNLYFDATGDMPSHPELQKIIEDEILKPPAAAKIKNVNPGFTEARERLIATLENDYSPVWDKQQQGFVFRHKASGLLMNIGSPRGVEPLVVDVLNVRNQPIEEKVRDFIEERRRKAKEASQAQKEVLQGPHGSFIPRIP